MEVLVFAFLPVLLVFGIPIGLSLIGVALERNHEQQLDDREARVAGFPMFDVRSEPPGITAHSGMLVSGNVVMGTGYLKQLLASFRTLVGGEVRGYQRVLTRARREAQLRMVESAIEQGARAIINVRFETSDVGGAKPFAEIFCYGTAIR